MQKLDRDFFLQNSDDVAIKLLGKMMVINHSQNQQFKAIITETESYRGADPASHASSKMTSRNQAMFMTCGTIYVYLIYGMHYCLNFVCEAEGFPSAVLIRAVQVIEPNFLELDGPGRVCKNLKIDKSFNKTNIFIERKIEVFDVANKVKYLKLPRVGISKNKEALLRFKIIK